MGSGAMTAAETAVYLAERGERVGVVQMRLHRPFPVAAFLAALPGSVRRVAVLDRTKEPGSLGEPLFLNVVAALAESMFFGLGSDGTVGANKNSIKIIGESGRHAPVTATPATSAT